MSPVERGDNVSIRIILKPKSMRCSSERVERICIFRFVSLKGDLNMSPVWFRASEVAMFFAVLSIYLRAVNKGSFIWLTASVTV